MFFLVAKIKDEDLVSTLMVLKTEKGETQKKAILDLVDYFNPLISAILGNLIKSDFIYKKYEKQVKNFIIEELTYILLKSIKTEELKNADFRSILSYVKQALVGRVSKSAIDAALDRTSLVMKEDQEYKFNNALKKFFKKYKRLPVLEIGSDDLVGFAEFFGSGNEKKVLDAIAHLGRNKVKSLYEETENTKGGENLKLIDVLKSDDPLPLDEAIDAETKEKILPEMKRILEPQEMKVWMMWHDPYQQQDKSMTKQEIADELKITPRDVDVALNGAQKKLLKSPVIRQFKSAIQQLIKFACDNFEVVETNGTVRIARKNAESIIREIIASEVGKKFVCTQEGRIETMTGEARSADVKVGDIFTVINEHRSGLGYEGGLTIKGMWSHDPGFSGQKTDTTAKHYKFTCLLRKENINGNSDFFAQFKELE